MLYRAPCVIIRAGSQQTHWYTMAVRHNVHCQTRHKIAVNALYWASPFESALSVIYLNKVKTLASIYSNLREMKAAEHGKTKNFGIS